MSTPIHRVVLLAALGSAISSGAACNSGPPEAGAHCAKSNTYFTCDCANDGAPGNDDRCAAKGPDEFCCADADWPGDGNCYCKTNTVTCAVVVNDCTCSAYEAGDKSTTCYPGGGTSPPAATGSEPGACCLFPGSNDLAPECICRAFGGCEPGETQVETCTAALVPNCVASDRRYSIETQSCHVD